MKSPSLAMSLERTIEVATFEFEYFTTDRLPDGLSSTTKGYCDLKGPVVAAELTVDIRIPGSETKVQSFTYTSGDLLYQAASEDLTEWVELETHGVGSTALSTLYWLYGVQNAMQGADADKVEVLVSFPLLFDSAPSAVVESLREGILETRPDLIGVTASGQVVVADDGLIRRIDLELPAFEGPDPSLNQPAMMVTLSLTPTKRRAITFPDVEERMTAQKFKNLMLYGDDTVD